jgi:hypothetical protein
VATHEHRPLRRRIQASVMRVINVPMRFVLGLPFATPLGGRLMLVFLTGRKTGRSYRQPVSYVRDGATLLSPGGGRWKLNLQDGRPERVRLRGRDVLARPELVGDVDEVDRLLGFMMTANPRVRSFVGIPTGSGGRLDRGASRPRSSTASASFAGTWKARKPSRPRTTRKRRGRDEDAHRRGRPGWSSGHAQPGNEDMRLPVGLSRVATSLASWPAA